MPEPSILSRAVGTSAGGDTRLDVNSEHSSLDPLTNRERSERMSRIRPKDTKPEIRARRIVHRLGYRYRLHAIDPQAVPFVTRALLHCCPSCSSSPACACGERQAKGHFVQVTHRKPQVLARRLAIQIYKVTVAALRRTAADVHVDLPATRPLSGSVAESWQPLLGAGHRSTRRTACCASLGPLGFLAVRKPPLAGTSPNSLL